MTALRATIESDLASTLEGEFSTAVTLVAPDGTVYTGLVGQVLYDQRRVEPDTGAVVVVHEPVVTLRRSSLTRVPVAGERWEVKFPISPVAGAAVTSFLLSAARAPEGGETLGIIRLYAQKVSQSP